MSQPGTDGNVEMQELLSAAGISVTPEGRQRARRKLDEADARLDTRTARRSPRGVPEGGPRRVTTLRAVLDTTAHSALLPLDTDRWRLHANAARLLGTLGRAQAAMCVVDGRASYVLTSEPHVYGEGIPTIAI